jgi:hypothetical protein
MDKYIVREILNFVGFENKIYIILYRQAQGIYDPNYKKMCDVSYDEYYKLTYSDCISKLNLVKPNYATYDIW